MIILHHLTNSRSQRILWLLEELGLEYEVVKYQRLRTLLAPPELRKVHPLGKSPVITDGDLVIAESGAIIEYLVNKYGPSLKPTAEKDLLSYTYWLHFAEGSAMLPLILHLIFYQIQKKSPFFIRPISKLISDNIKKLYIKPNIERNFDFMEETLSKQKWFAGENFSAADIQMSYPIESAETAKLLGERPHLKNFLREIKKREAYLVSKETPQL